MDQNEIVKGLLIDLPKAFDFVENHHLLIVKFPQYGLDEKFTLILIK